MERITSLAYTMADHTLKPIFPFCKWQSLRLLTNQDSVLCTEVMEQ